MFFGECVLLVKSKHTCGQISLQILYCVMLRTTLLFANRTRSNTRKAMEQHGIFADVIDKFTPTITLDVSISSNMAVLVI